MKPAEITQILGGATPCVYDTDCDVTDLLTDSRHLANVSHSLFFAIPTKRNTGSRFVYDVYQQGGRNFVVPNDASDLHMQQFRLCRNANFWYVKDVVLALQQIAAWHRHQYNIPVVGITGSNGKTIVKDWIVQMLHDSCSVVSSPRSYNSQIGVPLSVWQMSDEDEFAVFEAGISQVGEMDRLRRVIDPTIGIFTNIGQAHDENFLTRSQKIAEKLQLFTHCEVLIYCADHREVHSAILAQECFRNVRRYTWGTSEENPVQFLEAHIEGGSTLIKLRTEGVEASYSIPFVDRASLQNAMHCITLLSFLGYDHHEIAARCRHLTPVSMRMEMNEALNNSLLINDSYSLDLNSLTIALDYLQQEPQHPTKALIMSDILQSGIPEPELYAQAAKLILQHGINHFVGIGEALCRHRNLFASIPSAFYATTEECLCQHPFDHYLNATILLKGARRFHFEVLAKALQRKSHQTVMEVNLDNLISNLNYYRSLLKPATKLMAMVKAASYGAGTTEVANALQYHHADYLTVAYCDEGVELRRNGITLPIMVMNPEEESFADIIRYHLEPDIYSFRILEAFSQAVRLHGGNERVPVHIEYDTGMHRLGFDGADTPRLIAALTSPDSPLMVRSIFSHLACSEDPSSDHFTNMQIARFTQWCTLLRQSLATKHPDPILCHILNSSGITRFPQAQMDMVRLGIGLYGISPEPDVQQHLKPVSRLKTKISQIKNIPVGDSVGYNRRWIAQRPSRIAIISIGYADGLNRHLGYGNGRVTINGCQAPIIGSICMDMCFLDVTDINCDEGDEVTIFGDADLLQQIASSADTIPYEILTSVSPRVRRIYYQE
ncbi:MAG: bifunctional UDP-N-acetylmuramoyl-tripeptide:D-alanyl-D-alanine ligase/alanine racemase [Bacteroidales bacterium]|nr:bifunctional UDP-N-acetylmuramoyl-tripeptide:D-alanyl-D-alanine ligase/alanine racemase [Bacteroidales bacterium]